MLSRSLPDSTAMLRLVPREGEPLASVPAQNDDDALLAAVRRGDPKEAGLLRQRAWPQVDRTVRRLLGKTDPDRDDLSQLALIDLVRSIDGYRGDCSLDTWAKTVTSHVVFKHIRRWRTERQFFIDLLADDGELAELLGPVLDDERRSLSRDLLARIATLLDTMNRDRAWAFILHDVLGYSARDHRHDQD